MSEIKKKISFETAFERLVQISNDLEGGQKTLEESIKLYEESVELKKFCETFIQETKSKIESINKQIDNQNIINK